MIADCAVYRAGERRPGSLRLERAAAASQQADSFVWLALHEPTPYELTTTRAHFGLDALAVADTPKQHKRPAMQIHGEVLFAVLKTARYIEAQEAVRLGQLVLFVGHRFLVSIQSDDAGSGVVAAARKELEARPELLHNGPCTVMYAIVDRIVDDYVAVLAAMDADLHQIEQEVFSPEVRQPGGRIYWHTREVRDFQRATVPLVDMLLHLAAGRFPAVPTSVRVYFGGVEDRLQRVVEEVERNSALLASMLSANSSQLATRQAELALEQTRLALRQNEDMRKISAWVAIVAVPTLIAGIYGMNFDHMPELSSPFGYPAALGAMSAISLVLYLLFRRSGWL